MATTKNKNITKSADARTGTAPVLTGRQGSYKPIGKAKKAPVYDTPQPIRQKTAKK